MAHTVRREPFKPGRKDPCFCGSGRRFKACCGSMSEPRNPPHGVHIVPGFLDAQTCADWVTFFETCPRFDSIVMDLESDSREIKTRKEDFRVTENINPGERMEGVREFVERALRDEVPDKMGRQVAWYELPQVLRYGPGGHYDIHSDSDNYYVEKKAWFKTLDRDVSILVYLNEDFTGGSLSFPTLNYTYYPRIGDLVLFPSDVRYRHQANPVEEGLRYAIAVWAAFVDEPRVMDVQPDHIRQL